MPDPSRLDRFLTYRLHRVARLTDRDTAADYLAACDLNLAEARCLAAIGSFPALSLNDLARAANQDKGHASRSVRALVDRGLVDKQASADDRRGIVLGLTRKGRALHAKAIALIAARNDAAFAVLTGAERKALGEMLDRVAGALDPR